MTPAAGDSPLDPTSSIRELAAASGLAPSDDCLRRLAAHARAVLGAPPELHVTSIRDPSEFAQRHVGEALQGAAMLEEELTGDLLDLGSGNGYPGLAVCMARPGLRPVLAEASRRRAAFLSDLLRELFPSGEVLHAQVQRADDLRGHGPFRVIVCRAAGGWEKILPRLRTALAPDGRLMVWAGPAMESVSQRSAWRNLTLVEQAPLRGRNRSWIWRFR